MSTRSIALSLIVGAALVAGCKKQTPDADSTVAPAQQPATAAAGDDVPGNPASKTSRGFDIESVPVSTAPLGDFPYISIPAGYSTDGRTDETKDFARFPFWVDGAAQWVEGRFHLFDFSAEEGKNFSQFEVRRNIEELIKQMGGVKVSEGKIPDDVVESWGDEITEGFLGGIGDIYNEPASTYLVHRSDGNIWIHFVANTSEGWMVVGKEKGFEATSALLPASELKQQLDADGKVALQVNFATDKTQILPDSQAQIDQVVQLLKDDPTLKLAINGHTDNTGDAVHNQRLSEGRAQSVVAAIVAKGIDARRMSAKGFGDSQPVADNGDEQGKAKNRRVELVKQ